MIGKDITIGNCHEQRHRCRDLSIMFRKMQSESLEFTLRKRGCGKSTKGT